MSAAPLPQPPSLEFCFEAQVDIDAPLVIEPGAHAIRRIIPILGGSVNGPKFNGRVIPGGADWQYVRHDGVLCVEAKYTLASHDGTLVMVNNLGMRHGPPEVIAALGRGEPVPTSAYYFRTVPSFEAPSTSACAWMNKAIFVCTAERQARQVFIQFFQVL